MRMAAFLAIVLASLSGPEVRQDVPISVEDFADGINHYQSANDRYSYPRHAPEDLVAIADNILLYQRTNGGWPENHDPLRILSETEVAELRADRDLTDTSLDNRATYPQIRYLAEAFTRSGLQRYADAARRGLAFLRRSQLESGGWPHSAPDGEGYRGLITFMDGVMVGALDTLRAASTNRNGSWAFLSADDRAAAAAAVARAEQAILDLQIEVDGRLKAWAGQYDSATLQPTTARSYELPGVVSAESVSVVRYLMSLEDPSPAIVRAVQGAVRWFDEVKIDDLRVEHVELEEPVRYRYFTATIDRVIVQDPEAPPIWARFYELDTDRPFMANRDGTKVYSLAEVEHERRVGYGWYTGSPATLLVRDYPLWQQRWAPDENVLESGSIIDTPR